jgi:hypothetical protein
MNAVESVEDFKRFYQSLDIALSECKSKKVVIGGDSNCRVRIDIQIKIEMGTP